MAYVVTRLGGARTGVRARVASNGRQSMTATTHGEQFASVRSPQPVAIPDDTAGSIPQNSANTAAGQAAAMAQPGSPVDIHSPIGPAIAGGIGRQIAASRLSPGIPYRAAPTQATVVKEVDENGVVISSTNPDTADSDDRAALLDDIVKNHGNAASSELLQLFEQARSIDDKNEILSSATQIPSDQNTRTLLELALSPSQPAELRRDAVLYAADQQPDLLSRFTDDPTLGVEVQSILSAAEYPENATINGANSHPPLGKTSRPPANANQALAH
ncbi:MAG TPA: hypothetical protein VL171_07585 [Verrucomicrobiae bacterium]|nr:hypothetical protein [Verrucomicrobiae bacterium]